MSDEHLYYTMSARQRGIFTIKALAEPHEQTKAAQSCPRHFADGDEDGDEEWLFRKRYAVDRLSSEPREQNAAKLSAAEQAARKRGGGQLIHAPLLERRIALHDAPVDGVKEEKRITRRLLFGVAVFPLDCEENLVLTNLLERNERYICIPAVA